MPLPTPEFSPNLIIRMDNITREYPGVVANKNVHLHVRSGAFHAVIGENGAGKSTLLNILYGRCKPDAGRIFLKNAHEIEEEVTNALNSPADAIRRGIGLVSQHYTLIPAFTVLENVMLGAETPLPGGFLQPRRAAERTRELAAHLGIESLDLNARAGQLSVASQQKVEIIKALYRGARILLLDEPTATLAPPEAEALFTLLHTLISSGTTVVFITHKLREVVAHSDAVTILRTGQNAGDFRTADTDTQELMHRMIGGGSRAVTLLNPDFETSADVMPRTSPRSLNDPEASLSLVDSTAVQPASETIIPSPLMQIEDAVIYGSRRTTAISGARLAVGRGEIVGVAGVDGSGQRELSEAIVGLRRLESGRLFLEGTDITNRSVRHRQDMGIAYLPEDRHRAGIILHFSIAENYLLGHEDQQEWGGGIMLDRPRIWNRAAEMLRRYDVRSGTNGVTALAGTLSGGNQQKVVFARAMDANPRLLIACQPTRGLDVAASRFVYDTLRRARADGLGVLLFSLDLDEILDLSDRVAVLYAGRVAGVLSRSEVTREAVGALMTGAASAGGRVGMGAQE